MAMSSRIAFFMICISALACGGDNPVVFNDLPVEVNSVSLEYIDSFYFDVESDRGVPMCVLEVTNTRLDPLDVYITMEMLSGDEVLRTWEKEKVNLRRGENRVTFVGDEQRIVDRISENLKCELKRIE